MCGPVSQNEDKGQKSQRHLEAGGLGHEKNTWSHDAKALTGQSIPPGALLSREVLLQTDQEKTEVGFGL